jgi:phosphate/sulfate permease
MNTWLLVTILLSFAMAFAIGSNDAANGLGTSYGTRAISLRWLIILGAIAEFIGAFFLSNKVAVTLAYDVIEDLRKTDEDVQRKMMFSVCLASFIFIMASSISGMPISGTHTVVGALMGAGIVGTGFENVNWGKMLKILVSWFISPAISALLAFLLMFAVVRFTMRSHKVTYRGRLLAQQTIFSFCIVALAIIADTLLNRNTSFNDGSAEEPKSTHYTFGLSNSAYFSALIAIALVVGSMVYRVALAFILTRYGAKSLSAASKLRVYMTALFLLTSTELFEALTLNIRVLNF